MGSGCSILELLRQVILLQPKIGMLAKNWDVSQKLGLTARLASGKIFITLGTGL